MMDRFDEDGYQQLLRNQANAEAERIKQRQSAKREVLDEGHPKQTWKGGATPKPMPPDEPVTDKDGRVINVCPACGAKWGDCLRQFTTGGVDMFHCHCKPLRSFERYKT